MALRSARIDAVTVLLLATLPGGCGPATRPAEPATVFTYHSPLWYEETLRYFQVSRDGARTAYGAGVRGRLIDLTSGELDSTGWRGPLGVVSAAAFGPSATLARLGSRGEEAPGWFLGDVEPLPVPAGALPRWSFDGSRLAWFTPGDSVVTIVPSATPRTIPLPGGVTGLEWASGSDAVYATLVHADGLTTLVRADTGGAIQTVRDSLDASPAFNTLAVAPDGRSLFLALAGDHPPDVRIRHDPEAPRRDLDIYRLALPDGALARVAGGPGDDFAPALAADALYWTHNDPVADVVVLPIAGGEPRVVADHGFWPRWSPDGRQIAFTRAYFRISDYGLDMDGWIVDLDTTAAPKGAPRPWITGYGEDMGPVWSPDGKWVAYHSHRSRDPVPLYGSPGRTDDQWLQLTSGGPEIRVTDFGFEVGPPDWSPDGRQLLFDSWAHDGVPRMAQPWITTIDPKTGATRQSRRIPLPAGVVGINGEAWSPDGRRIAFTQRIDASRQALWTMRHDGSDARRLVEFPSFTIGGVAWTRDGARLVYAAVADDHLELFTISSNGGSPTRLTHGAANVLHPRVSPDGQLVAASRIAWRKELRRVPV